MSANGWTKGLIELAKRIGRWLIEHLAMHGLQMLLGYMNGKIGDFRRRIVRIQKFTKKPSNRTARRIRWLEGRIARWTNAMSWLKKNAPSLTDAAVKEFVKKSDELAAIALDTEPSEAAA